MKGKELLYWLWLSLACRPGSALPSTLLKFFGSPKKIYDADEDDFAELDIPFYGHEKDLCDKSLDRAKDILAWCKKEKVGLATPDDYFYPDSFRVLPNKPMVLYYLGNFCDFENRFTVGVVGTRHPSNYGIHAAKRISYDLARSGAVIVSGLATGIDAAAHRAALYHESFTVGIIGCGIDKVYPKENAELYEEVIRKGLIMTEYPPGTAPMGKNFPVRNRLISALSDAVCVIEGSEQSGSLITAEDALKQGKALYAVPGSIFARESAGSNFLLRIGAKPCLSAYDLVEDFRSRYPSLEGAVALFAKTEVKQKKQEKKKTPDLKKKIRSYVFPGSARNEEEKAVPTEYEFVLIDASDEPRPTEGEKEKEAVQSSCLPQLSPEERSVYSALGYEPVNADSLVSQELSASALLRILTKLEIKGLVRKVPGGKYVLTDRAEM
ncbi:MAG: DNA-protecting protein DprA [Ruminococcaceae bacterium]|nr:DNA-protecting protein DprA [Oscillospiraceae bacterium]